MLHEHRPDATAHDFASLSSSFRWDIPQQFNIATACLDVCAAREPDRVALLQAGPDGREAARLTYGALRMRADALARGLVSLGIQRGDRVALYLPQGFDVVVAHMAIYKIGAIAVPLALLFGPEALSFRLGLSGARAIITNHYGHEKLGTIALPEALEHILVTDARIDGTISVPEIEAAHAGPFDTAETGPDDPALMIFTSGTTGPPKGALHGHRVLLGHIPGVQIHHEFLPQPDDRLWTPADWAWAGGLLNVLLPGLYLGVPVVAGPFERFDAEKALGLMEHMGVRNAFIPPTALRMLRMVDNIGDRFNLQLRTIGSGGEALGAPTLAWAQDALGLTINEFYGQTECNLVLSSIGKLGVVRPGAIGRPVPGHEVAIIDDDGREVPRGTPGQIAIRRPDPVMFLGYWQDDAATARKFIGDWMTTGDQGVMDAEGYVHFFGRDDDVIISAGYRIGPGEIEDCLIRHPAVALAAAVGKPDPVRTEIVKAFIVLKPGQAAGPELARQLQQFVRERLSAHEYPREVAFVEELPMTTTGKIIRRALREA